MSERLDWANCGYPTDRPARGGGRLRDLGAAACLLLAGLFAVHGRPAAGTELPPQAFHLVSESFGTPRTWVFDLAQRGDALWAVGNFGINVRRPHSAKWENVVAPEQGRLPLSISFAPSGAGIAVGQAGAVWDVAAGSEQWAPGSVGGDDRLFGAVETAHGDAIAVGAFGAIFMRAAGAKDWRRLATSWGEFDAPHLYAVLMMDSQAALVAGEHGTILRIADGAIAERQQHGEESLFAIIHCGGNYVAGGQEGAVLASPDGSAWNVSRIVRGFDVYGLGCLPDDRVVALGAGTMQIGSPGGAWQPFAPNSTRPGWFSSVVVSGSTVLLGGQGDIWRAQFASRNE
jgi:hypothetical protein